MTTKQMRAASAATLFWISMGLNLAESALAMLLATPDMVISAPLRRTITKIRDMTLRLIPLESASARRRR